MWTRLFPLVFMELERQNMIFTKIILTEDLLTIIFMQIFIQQTSFPVWTCYPQTITRNPNYNGIVKLILMCLRFLLRHFSLDGNKLLISRKLKTKVWYRRTHSCGWKTNLIIESFSQLVYFWFVYLPLFPFLERL